MVKTKALILIACVSILADCGLLGRSERASPDLLEIARGRLGQSVSLVRAGATLVAVYSDWETTGLYSVQIPVADSLPAAAPVAKMIDRIDMTLPVSPSFGEQVALARGNTVTVMYLARVGEDKQVLKVASRDIGAPAWTVDAIEPYGDPLAILPAENDRLDVFWASGALLHMSYPQNGQPDPLLDRFLPAGRASVFFGAQGSPRGMTAYDQASRSLFVFSWNGAGYDRTTMEGGGPVHSSFLLGDGRLVVLSWDQKTKRLELLQGKNGEARASRTLVTLTQDTGSVAVLPSIADWPDTAAGDSARMAALRADSLLFLYDEARPMGAGRSVHELSLLAPGTGWGPAAHRYRKMVLLSGDEPISSFSAVEVEGSLYVLVHQGSLKLLRLGLPRR